MQYLYTVIMLVAISLYSYHVGCNIYIQLSCWLQYLYTFIMLVAISLYSYHVGVIFHSLACQCVCISLSNYMLLFA